MARIPREISNVVNRLLSSIRSSLDGNNRLERQGYSTEDQREIYLRFEDLRFRFRSGTSYGREIDRNALYQLEYSLRDLMVDERFMAVASTIRYRPIVPHMDGERYRYIHPQLLEGRISVAEAIVLLAETIVGLPRELELDALFDRPTPESDLNPIDSVERLRAIVPKQQSVAPVQFDIIDNRLVIAPQPNSGLVEDEANILASRTELIERGKGIIDQLERSNCDKRLIETFQDLQNKLDSDFDVIRLGLSNIACGVMREQFHCELPDAVIAMMKSHTIGVGMYVGQFPDWQRFSEQAATAELSSADIPQISAAVEAAVTKLENRPDIADEQVPRTLKALRKLIEDPKATTIRAIFAVWRSLENLVIKVYSYGADFLDKTINKAIDTGSTIAGRWLVTALMAAALASGVAMTPIAARISQSEWIAKASDVVRSQIEALGG